MEIKEESRQKTEPKESLREPLAVSEDEMIEKIIARTKNYAMAEWNEVLTFVRRPWRLLAVNFFMGLFRGIGFFLGMTIVGAALLALILKSLGPITAKITELDVPVLSRWLATLISETQKNISTVKGG